MTHIRTKIDTRNRLWFVVWAGTAACATCRVLLPVDAANGGYVVEKLIHDALGADAWVSVDSRSATETLAVTKALRHLAEVVHGQGKQ